MAGALAGIQVLDFGQYIAGPLTAMLLADQGADVIRVDPPGGPVWDTPANATWNRGKRSITLDLKQPGDQEIARRLAERADVIIENFRPGVMDRLGLGAAALTAAHPRLVYCSLPGFATDDPRAGEAGWEGVIGAATATYRPAAPGGPPVYTAIPISSMYAAFQGAASIAVALSARERSGLGQSIEVPLFDATFAAIGSRGLRYHGPQPEDDPAATLMRSLSSQFQCSDGRWVMYVGGNLNARDFVKAIGAGEWFEAACAGRMSPEEFLERVRAVYRTRPSWEWERYAEELGTECAVCRTSAEWLEDPGALGSEIIIDSEDPHLGTVRGPGLNVRMSETVPAIRSARPLPDAHREEILAALATPPPAESGALHTELRAALEGVKVIDLCIILAGPTCGRTLAEFGADVVKIDSPSRRVVAFHNDVNRGKRSLVLDLKTEEGLAIFWRLVEDADVVVQNFRKGVAERLGIGYEAVRARRPDIVYASLNTYGRVGPYADRPGHEQIAQAATGMQERYGGDGRPTLQPFPVNDYGTGLMGAYGVTLALLHRQRTGQGQHVNTALAYTSTLLQSSLIQDYDGKQWDAPRGQDALGSGPLHRAYQAADGWLFLAARPVDLARAADLADLAGRDVAELERALVERIRSRPVEAWVSALTGAGIGAHRVVMDVREVMDDPWSAAHGLSLTRQHEDVGLVTTNGPAPRLSRTPVVPGNPASKPGADAASVLADIGRLDQLDGLVKTGVVVLDGVYSR